MSMKLVVLFLLVSVAVSPSVGAPEPQDEPQAPCPLMWNPVCGSDGNTYPNSICLKGADPGLEIAYEGECQ